MPVLQSKNEYKETERKCKASCGKWEQRNECEKGKKGDSSERFLRD